MVDQSRRRFASRLSGRQIVKIIASSILSILCVYFAVKIAIDFFNEPIAVKITEQLENEIFLPEIMICPMDPLNITKLRMDGFPIEAINAFHWHFVQDLYNHIANNALDFKMTFELPNITHFVAREDWATLVKTYGISCEGMLAFCSFYNKPFNCCATAKPVFHEKQGICYKLPKNTYPDSSKVERSGGNSALVLILNVPYFNQSRINLVSLESGAMLEYGHELKPPFTYGSHAHVRLPTNFSTEIGLFRTYHDRIFSSKNPCTNEEPTCRLECLNDGMQQHCNCSSLGFSDVTRGNSSVHVCNPLDVPKCLIIPAFGDYYNQKCSHMQCYVPCNEWIYTTQVSFGNLNQKIWEVYEGTYVSFIRVYSS